MEILAPAGTLQHIKMALDNKVNAVYGGIRKWNARGRTKNFSMREYNDIIVNLHKHNIKFFLTLNILFFDNEIKSVLSFLRSSSIQKPDAFIVTDLGLITKLKKEFPNIPVHLSTQFGTHTFEDIDLAKELGAERVILSRELTLPEIRCIRAYTDIELECFVSGSQCVSFSGLCYFSSLLNSGSGNRGTCLINCRDLYKANKNFGELLYTPDLNCIDLLNKINDIESFKLEGRRRNPHEIEKIIKSIRSKIPNQYPHAGFIYGTSLKENNLYSKISKRHTIVCSKKELNFCDKNDICAQCKDGIPCNFVETSLDEKDIFYLNSQFTKKYDLNKKNISFEFKLSNSKITEISYINRQGKGKNFASPKKGVILNLTIEDFVSYIEKNNSINVFKVSYTKTPLTTKKLKINELLLKEIVKVVEKDNTERNITFANNTRINQIFLETDQVSILSSFIDDPFVVPIFNIASIHRLNILRDIKNEFGNKIYYKLPILNFENIGLKQTYETLNSENVIFTRLSQVCATKDMKFRKKIADYTIAPWNKQSLLSLKKWGIDVFTASPEMSYEQSMSILRHENIQFILAGHLPLIYTRHCFRHLFGCKNCTRNQTLCKKIHNSEKNINFNVLCYPDYRILLSEFPILNNYPKLDPNIGLRYIATGETKENIKKSLNLLKQENYYDLLKQEDFWNCAYTCNLYDKRR